MMFTCILVQISETGSVQMLTLFQGAQEHKVHILVSYLIKRGSNAFWRDSNTRKACTLHGKLYYWANCYSLTLISYFLRIWDTGVCTINWERATCAPLLWRNTLLRILEGRSETKEGFCGWRESHTIRWYCHCNAYKKWLFTDLQRLKHLKLYLSSASSFFLLSSSLCCSLSSFCNLFLSSLSNLSLFSLSVRKSGCSSRLVFTSLLTISLFRFWTFILRTYKAYTNCYLKKC